MIAAARALERRLAAQPALVSFVLVAAFIVALCVAFEPRFETSDDIAMSMAAHGYGDAAYGAPQLIYSHVVWGFIVRAVPTIGGVLGYSLATVAVLLLAGWAMLYFLLRLGVGTLAAALATALVLARPVLFPQFTLNAGLLALAAIIGWRVYAKESGTGVLVASCLMAFLAYVIRREECLLVLAVGLPFLPWRAIRERSQLRVSLALLLAALFSAEALDRWSYRGPEWQQFWTAKAPLSLIAGLSYGDELKKRPGLLAKHGFSTNDITLIENALFADSKVSDAAGLNAMIAELGPVQSQRPSFERARVGLVVAAVPALWPLVLGAGLVFLLSPRKLVVTAWLLCVLAVVAISFSGRPGVVRVHLPMAWLLLLAPLLAAPSREGVRYWVTVVVLALAMTANARILIPQASESTQRVREFQRDAAGIPAETIVNWANAFRHEYFFPLLARDERLRAIRIHDLSGFTFAPFAVAAAERAAGRELGQQLVTPEGVQMFGPYSYMLEQLRVYCGERLKGRLSDYEFKYAAPTVNVIRLRCGRQ